MSGDKRRDVRIGGIIEISVLMRDVTTGMFLAGPIPGRINNIGTHGVGISLNLIRIEPYHFFYSVFDSVDIEIVMEVLVPETQNAKFVIPLRPVWFDRDLSNSKWPFVMGLEFLSGPRDEQVQNLLKFLRNSRIEGDAQPGNILSRIRNFFE